MPVKKKKEAEAARLGMWDSLHRDFVLSMVTKMSLGQSGEVDKRQSTKLPLQNRLGTAINSPKLFFGSIYAELPMLFAVASKYAPSSWSVVSGLALRFRKR